jgi:hypothetical protein
MSFIHFSVILLTIDIKNSHYKNVKTPMGKSEAVKKGRQYNGQKKKNKWTNK